MSQQMKRMFARITKIDEAKKLVYGRLVAEEIDKANEVFDYEKSKPYFERWSAEVSKDTGGKSVGNMRAMHGKVAAGKFTEMTFNDKDKAIDVVGKVVDEKEWEKCVEGVYTGFSIGGKYVDRQAVKINDKDVTRYVADPIEGSLVDRPMIPSCKFFDIQRADGSVAKIEIKGGPARGTLVEQLVAKGQSLDALSKMDDLELAEVHSNTMAEKFFTPDEEKELLRGITDDEQTQYAKLGPSERYDWLRARKAKLDTLKQKKSYSLQDKDGKLVAKVDLETAPKAGDELDVVVQDKTTVYRVDAIKDVAVTVSPKPEEMFIPGTEKDVERLITVMAAAKLGAGDLIAAAERAARVKPMLLVGSVPDLSKIDKEKNKKEYRAALRKGLVCVASFAYLIDSLRDLQEKVEYEQVLEGDDSSLPSQLKACIAVCGEVLQNMLQEELSEIASDTDDGNHAMYAAMSERATLKKRFESFEDAVIALAKASKPGKAFAEKLHKMAADMGAKCFGKDDGGDDAAMAATPAGLAKLLGSPQGQEAVKAAAKALVDPIEARLAKIEAQPEAPMVRVRAVAKGEDLGSGETPGAFEPVKKADGSVDESATLIKQAQALKVEPVLHGDGSLNEPATMIKIQHRLGGRPVLGAAPR